MSEYFPEPKSSGERLKVELDLFRNIQQVLIHQNLLKVDLVSLKSNVDQLDIDKLKNVPTNLSNLKSKADKLDNHN